jgi:nicotinamide mononucleotide adenylyltransferase
MIARWKPVHNGQVAVLRALFQSAEQVLIGIGSSNRYNARNPFTLEETEDMLRLALEDISTTGVSSLRAERSNLLVERGLLRREERPPRNDEAKVEIIPVPDLDDGPRWRVMVKDLFGNLDLFVTDNPYVANLMKDIYPLARPVDLVPSGERVRVDGSMVRARMARGERSERWQDWVPARCVEYIESRGLDERFRREFGLQTLALETVIASNPLP